MPRPIATVRVPVGLARDIDRLLHFGEAFPVVGGDAKRVRAALHALQPSIFDDEPRNDSGTACEVCGEPIPMERILNAAMRGQRAAYDTDRCRETARKRRYRAT